MRLVPLLLVCLLLITGAGAPPANAPANAPDRQITVVNRSDRTINEVYASPSHLDDWGPDRLGDGTIAPKQSRRLALGPGSGAECVFDVQVVYSDASREERRAVDLCRSRLLPFDAALATAPPGAQGGEHTVLIDNEAGLPIQQVLISPAEAGDWGEDRLAHDSLSVGETAGVTYRGDCLADLRVVFENRSAEERRGLDLCMLRGVTIRPGWTTATQLAPPHPAESVSPPLPLSVSVVNHSGRTVNEFYLFPEVSGDPGPDRLGATPLEDGGQVVVDLLRPPGSCRYAARIVYGGKVPVQDLGGIDLCHDPVLVVPPRS